MPSPTPEDQAQYEGYLGIVRKRVIGFAAPRVGLDSAEDIAQEVLTLLVQKYSGVRDLTEMIQISVGIARNKIFERFRLSHRETELPENAPGKNDIHDEVERRQVMNRVVLAIMRLGERCRNVLKLKLLEEQDSLAIQQILNAKSINTVYTWEHRCFKQLIQLLDRMSYPRT